MEASVKQTTIYSKNNPFLAKILDRRRLTHPDSEKNTQHIVVDISESEMQYECGDSLGVYPTNDPKHVEALLHALAFSGTESVCLPKEETEILLKEAFLYRLTLAKPTKKFLTWLRNSLTDSKEKTRLTDLLNEEKARELKEYLENREYLDIAEEFPSAQFTAQEYVMYLRKLLPRLYSIASSPEVHPDEVHLTVGVINYKTNKKSRIGVASTYLTERAEIDKETIPVFVASSHFRLPEDLGRDIIMIGPGTGVAPFRGFMQKRIESGSQGRTWLFFGEQRRAYDYLYGNEWNAWHETGKLTRLNLAFSRDQDYKIYVQSRMLEKETELWRWLENGAYVYVCGDMKRMAKDVDQTLHKIAEKEGKMNEEEAKQYIKQLKKEKRYQKDVY